MIISGSCEFLSLEQTAYNVLHPYEFHAVSIYLSRALMVTGKQSVSPMPGLNLGAFDRMVAAVWFQEETQSVSRCTDPGLPFLHSHTP